MTEQEPLGSAEPSKPTASPPPSPAESRRTEPTITLLPSGYWHVRWSRMAWAQWPRGRDVTRDDFFQPGWSYSEKRREQADCLSQAFTDLPTSPTGGSK